MASNTNQIIQASRYVSAILNDLSLLKIISNVLNCEGQVADWDISSIGDKPSLPNIPTFDPVLVPPTPPSDTTVSNYSSLSTTYNAMKAQYDIDKPIFKKIDLTQPFNPSSTGLSGDRLLQFNLDVALVNQQIIDLKNIKNTNSFIPVLYSEPDSQPLFDRSYTSKTDIRYTTKVDVYQAKSKVITDDRILSRDISGPLVLASARSPDPLNYPNGALDANYILAKAKYDQQVLNNSNINSQYNAIKTAFNNYSSYLINLGIYNTYASDLVNFIENTSTYKILNSISLILYQANLQNVLKFDINSSLAPAMKDYTANTINLKNTVSFNLSYMVNICGLEKSVQIFNAKLPDILPVDISTNRQIITPSSFTSDKITNCPLVLYNMFNVQISNNSGSKLATDILYPSASNTLALSDGDRIQIINNYIGQFTNLLNTLEALK